MDEDTIDADDFACKFVDEDSVNNRNQPRQYVMSECYGRDMRLCDIQVPAIPHRCLEQLRQGTSLNSDIAPYLRRRGKGRAEALRQKAEQNYCGTDMHTRPGGLADYLDKTSRRENSRSETSSVCDETASANEVSTGGWNIKPPNVVQLEGLPTDIDMDVLHDVIAHYGTIIQLEKREIHGEVQIRFKLNNADACSWLVFNIHDTDFLGSDSDRHGMAPSRNMDLYSSTNS